MKIRISGGESYKFKLLARRQRLLARLEQLKAERQEFLAAGTDVAKNVAKQKEVEMRKVAATIIRINSILAK